jgi:hypothetical protein
VLESRGVLRLGYRERKEHERVRKKERGGVDTREEREREK